MNRKKLIKKIAIVLILLGMRVQYATSFDPLKDIKQEISAGMPITNYYKKVLNAVENEKEWFVDCALYKIHNPCEVFNKRFSVFFDVYKEKTPETHERKYEKFFELILALAVQSGECWFSVIKKVKNLDTASYWLVRIAYAALQNYVYLVIKNKAKLIKNQKSPWYKRHVNKFKLLFYKIPDFALIAAVKNLREVDKDAYKNFLKNMLNTIKGYLAQIPQEFIHSRLKFTDKEIDHILKALKTKLNSSSVRRHWRKHWRAYTLMGITAGLFAGAIVDARIQGR